MAMSRRAKASRSASCGASTASIGSCGSSPPDASPSSICSRDTGVLRDAGSPRGDVDAPPPEARPLLP